MSDFSVIGIQANIGSQGSPVWLPTTTTVLPSPGTTQAIRFYNTNAAGLTTALASWPNMILPGSTGGVPYCYAYTSDSVGSGVLGSSGVPTGFSNASYNQFRIYWDNVGTFASAPILTMFPTTAHGAVTRDDGTILGGSTDTTSGGNAFSYFKANAWGQVTSAGAANAAPTNAPVVTDGTVGVVSPSGGADWLVHYQGLAGLNDFIQAPFTPVATTADTWYFMYALFAGPNLAPTVYSPTLTLGYSHS